MAILGSCLRLAAGFFWSSRATKSHHRKGGESPQTDGTMVIQKKQEITLMELMQKADREALVAEKQTENSNSSQQKKNEQAIMKDLNQKATAEEDQLIMTIAAEEADKQKETDEPANSNAMLNLDNESNEVKMGSNQGWEAISWVRSKCSESANGRFGGLFHKRRSRVGSDDPAAGEAAPVYLNVYDLTPMINGCVYWAGLGAFHTGVEVHGVEYAYGMHDEPTSGVFKVKPRQSPGYTFKRSIFVGMTAMDPKQVREFMERQVAAGSYYGDTYHLVLNNCNHFSKSVCRKLTGRPIPKWVNRLARIGKTLIPESFKIAPVVGHSPYSTTTVAASRRRR